MDGGRLSYAALGRELGISKQAVAKLVRQGMPIESAAAAQAWRHQHLDPARIFNGNVHRAAQAVPPAESAEPDHHHRPGEVKALQRLVVLASLDFEKHHAELRAAMSRLQLHGPAQVVIREDLSDRLIARAALEWFRAHVDTLFPGQEVMTDEEARWDLATGEAYRDLQA